MSKFKPTSLKVLEGNPGKRPLNKNEPKPKPITPRCPTWIIAEAKREWKRVVPELERLGLLTCVDRAALTGYCQSWARYVEAENYLKKNATTFETDKGYIMQVPQVAIAQKYLKICQSFMADFGLTPSARGRIALPGGEEEDPLEELFNNS